MEKVKLTREQAEAIEARKGSESWAIVQHLEGWTWKENKCLNDLSMEQFVKALYIGYEVEETFEVGDWIYSKQVEKFIKIEDEGQLEGYNKFPSYYRSATPEEIAKEKQRRWWAKHDREVKEVKKGDIVKTVNGKMIEINQAEQLPNRFKVACFAEDRKDIKQ